MFHGGCWDLNTGFYKMGARYYDPAVGRFTQPEPAWSNPMFNTLGGRNLLVSRSYGTGATVGQGGPPMPGGYYVPTSEYNWYSYAGSDPVNILDNSGYFGWGNVLRLMEAVPHGLVVGLGGTAAGAALAAVGVALAEFGPVGWVGTVFFVGAGIGVTGLSWYSAYMIVKEAWE